MSSMLKSVALSLISCSSSGCQAHPEIPLQPKVTVMTLFQHSAYEQSLEDTLLVLVASVGEVLCIAANRARPNQTCRMSVEVSQRKRKHTVRKER